MNTLGTLIQLVVLALSVVGFLGFVATMMPERKWAVALLALGFGAAVFGV